MPASRCGFCLHDNPAGSKFCNECGSPLHLRPCPHCEAVNDDIARTCYRCAVVLPPPIDGGHANASVDDAQRAHVPEVFGQSLDAITRLQPPAIGTNSGDETQRAAQTSWSEVASTQSFVVDPDESRLASARSLAAAAQRQRRTRAALTVLLVIATTATVYYEYLPTDPIGDWLHALQVDVLDRIRARAPATSNAVDETKPKQDTVVAPPQSGGAHETTPASAESAPASKSDEPAASAAADVPALPAATDQNVDAPSAATR